MTAITASRIGGKILMISSEQLNFKVNLMACDKKNLTCSWLIKCINLVVKKARKMPRKTSHFISFFSSHLINSIIHEHPCKILNLEKYPNTLLSHKKT